MEKISNETALSHVNDLLSKVAIEKTAIEFAADRNEVPGQPIETTEPAVEKKDSNPTNHTEGGAQEGAFLAEKSQDVKDSSGGLQIEDPGAELKEGDMLDGKADTGDIGVTGISNIETISKKVDNSTINNKKAGETDMKRIDALGSKILEKLNKKASEREDTGFEKLSAEQQEEVLLFKEAAQKSYLEYMDSFVAGFSKKAEDMAAIQEATGASPEEAEAVLNEIAAEDPSLLLPEEGMSEEGIPAEGMPAESGELDPETMAALEDMSEEEVAQLIEVAEEMEANGVTPEELEAAMAEGGGEEEEGAPIADPGVTEEVPKMASEVSDNQLNLISTLIKGSKK